MRTLILLLALLLLRFVVHSFKCQAMRSVRVWSVRCKYKIVHSLLSSRCVLAIF